MHGVYALNKRGLLARINKAGRNQPNQPPPPPVTASEYQLKLGIIAAKELSNGRVIQNLRLQHDNADIGLSKDAGRELVSKYKKALKEERRQKAES
jgi:hypothetical protein